jgi:hypothetical protein
VIQDDGRRNLVFNGNQRIGKRVHRHYARTRVGEGICNADCGQRLVLANEDRAPARLALPMVVSLGRG